MDARSVVGVQVGTICVSYTGTNTDSDATLEATLVQNSTNLETMTLLQWLFDQADESPELNDHLRAELSVQRAINC